MATCSLSMSSIVIVSFGGSHSLWSSGLILHVPNLNTEMPHGHIFLPALFDNMQGQCQGQGQGVFYTRQ